MNNLQQDLQKDGLITDIYFLLWSNYTKSDALQMIDEEFYLNIPQTLLFKRNKTVAWFFTSKQGKLVQKNSQNLEDTDLIYAEFVSGSKDTDIAAYYIYEIESETLSNDYLLDRILRKNKQKHTITKREVCVEYLSPIQLYMIEIQWSGNICIYQKRKNFRKITDKKYDTYERAVTFEGPDFLSELDTVKSKVISQEIQEQCRKIAMRLHINTFKTFQIQRMACNFKLDQHNKIFFLYCTSLRLCKLSKSKDDVMNKKIVQQYTPLLTKNLFMFPLHVNKLKSTNSRKPITLQCSDICLQCSIATNIEDFVHVSVRELLTFQSQQRKTLKNDAKPSRSKSCSKIPLILERIYSKISKINYQQLKEDNEFGRQTVLICKQCYCELSDRSYMGGADPIRYCSSNIASMDQTQRNNFEHEKQNQRSKSAINAIIQRSEEQIGKLQQKLIEIETLEFNLLKEYPISDKDSEMKLHEKLPIDFNLSLKKSQNGNNQNNTRDAQQNNFISMSFQNRIQNELLNSQPHHFFHLQRKYISKNGEHVQKLKGQHSSEWNKFEQQFRGKNIVELSNIYLTKQQHQSLLETEKNKIILDISSQINDYN